MKPMPALAVTALDEALNGAHVYLEYGAGASTIRAADAGVPRIYSVESDPIWAAETMAKVVIYPSRTTMMKINIGPVARYGFPTSVRPGFADYVLAPWRRMSRDHVSPDLVLIDGRFRVACFMATLLHADANTRILFDDYGDRAHYHAIERFAAPVSMYDRMGEFVVPGRVDVSAWATLAQFISDPR